jgi:hypothetical protein
LILRVVLAELPAASVRHDRHARDRLLAAAQRAPHGPQCLRGQRQPQAHLLAGLRGPRDRPQTERPAGTRERDGARGGQRARRRAAGEQYHAALPQDVLR